MSKQLVWLLSLGVIISLVGCSKPLESNRYQDNAELSAERVESDLGSIKDKTEETNILNSNFDNIADYIKDNEETLNAEEILYDFGNNPLAGLKSETTKLKDDIQIDDLTNYTILDTRCNIYNAKLSPDKNKLYIEYTSNDNEGIITINKGDGFIVYKVNDSELISLVQGNGKYTVKLYTTKDGLNCTFKGSFEINVENSYSESAYKGQSYYSNYKADDSEFVGTAKELWSKSNDINDYIWNCYIYTSKYSYDYDKSTLINGGKIIRYRPDVSELVEEEKGICLDKSAVMASLLRAKDIPTKIVFGHYKDMYHAWVDVLVGNEWLMFDPTLKINYSNSGVNDYRVSRYN